MTQGQRHVIGTVTFEVESNENLHSLESAGGLADFVRERLLPMAEELFDELAPSDRVVRIDRLEVELDGALSGPHWGDAEPVFRERLREALLRQLAEEDGGGVGGSGGSAPTVRTLPRSALDELFFFLRTGLTSWSTPATGGEPLDHLVMEVLGSDPDAFVSLLREMRGEPRTLDRFVRQMGDGTLARVLETLLPGGNGIGTAFLEEFNRWSAREGSSESVREGWRRVLFRELLAALSHAGDGGPSQRLKRALPTPSPELPGELIQLLRRLPLPSGGGRLRSPLPPGREGEGSREVAKGTQEAPEVASPLLRLQGALRRGDPAEVERVWGEAKRWDEPLLVRTARSLLADPELRFKVASTFPTRLLMDLAAVLEPRAPGALWPLLLDDESGRPGRRPWRWEEVFTRLLGLPAPFSPLSLQAEVRGAVGEGEGGDARGEEGLPDPTRVYLGGGAGVGEGSPAGVGEGDGGWPAAASALEAAFEGGDYGEILPRLHGWLGTHPREVARLIRVHGRQARVRAGLVRSLPGAALLELVSILEPGAVGAVAETLRAPETVLSPLVPKGPSGKGRRAEEAFREFLWDQTFAHLLLDREEGFHREEYLRALEVRARGYYLRGWREGGRDADAFIPPLELENREADGEGGRGAKLQGARRGYELRELVLSALGTPGPRSPGIPPIPRSLREPLQELGREYPDHLLWLLDQLRSLSGPSGGGPSGGLSALLHRPVDEVRAFVGLLLDPGLQPGGSARGELKVAIGEVARGLSDPRGFLVATAEALLSGSAIDLEELREGSLPRSGAPEGEEVRERPAGAEPPTAPVPVPALAPSTAQTPAPTSAPTSALDLPSADALDVLRSLAGGGRPAPAALRAAVEEGLERDPAGLGPLLEEALGRWEGVAWLVESLPGSLMARVFLLLRPGLFPEFHRASDLMVAAAAGEGGAGERALLERARWISMARYLVEEGASPELTPFSLALLEALSRTGEGGLRTDLLSARIRSRLDQIAGPGDRGLATRLRSALSPSPSPPSPGPQSDEVPLAWTLDGETVISNAGAVLVAPFLPRLFATLGLTEQGVFRDLEAACRGAHLIQYLVEGRGDRPEYLLPLNRILCGIPEDEPLPRRIEISSVEAETIQGMLSAIIEQWGALGRTSVPGLQESFLQRRGTLRAEDERWRLHVEGKAFDMLLDRLPWSYAIVRFRWMPFPLHVEWR